MAAIGTLWAGSIFGTNTGNFFLKFDEVDPELKGSLRFLDSTYGVAVYAVQGMFGDTLELIGTPSQVPEGQTYGQIEVKAALTPEGQLRGEWASTTGTGGVFVAFPHDPAHRVSEVPEKVPVPEQIYTRVNSVGSVSLYAPDVLALIAELRKDFSGARLIATFSTGVGEITKYAEDFVSDFERLRTLTYLKLQIQEPEAHGINRVAVVELRASGANEVRVQGIGESWVIGRAEALTSFLHGYENAVITSYKRYGLNLNSAIFLGMLVAIPEISSMKSRAVFVVVVIALLAILLKLHSKLIPNATLRLSGPVPGRFIRILPTIGSWGSAIVTSIIASYVYTWLTTRGAP